MSYGPAIGASAQRARDKGARWDEGRWTMKIAWLKPRGET